MSKDILGILLGIGIGLLGYLLWLVSTWIISLLFYRGNRAFIDPLFRWLTRCPRCLKMIPKSAYLRYLDAVCPRCGKLVGLDG